MADSRDDDEPRDAEVLRPVFGAEYEIKHTFERRCRHRQLVVYDNRRLVECKACSAPVDPFGVLLGYARGERHWRSYEALCSTAQKKLAELKAEEKRIKARLRNARKQFSAILARRVDAGR